MTDHSTAHLSDDLLHEILDQAAAPEARASAQAHLAACQRCSQRLDDLGVLFASLAATPDVPLTRDLAPGVTQAVRRSRPALDRPSSAPRARLLQVLLPAQALAVVLVVVLAWPLFATLATQLAPPAFALIGEATTALRPLALSAGETSQWWAELQRTANTGWLAVQASPMLAVPVRHLAAAVGGSGLLWLLMNLYLLQPRLGRSTRRIR